MKHPQTPPSSLTFERKHERNWGEFNDDLQWTHSNLSGMTGFAQLKRLQRWSWRTSFSTAKRHLVERLSALSVENALVEAAKKSQTSISMQTLLDSGAGRRLGIDLTDMHEQDLQAKAKRQIASFLYREMPVRFAHRVLELQSLPYELCNMPSIKQVKHWYIRSFEDIMTLPPPINDESEKRFYDSLDSIYNRHAETQVTIAYGLREFRKSDAIRNSGKKLYEFDDIHRRLDSFNVSRIGIRMLLGHYLELGKPHRPGWVGLICEETSPSEVTLEAIEHATYMCDREFGYAPNVRIRGRTDLTFAYVPSHLYYILFELLKNSMKATCENHKDAAGDLPAVEIIVGDGEENEDIVIKISDEGGGIRRAHAKHNIFSYLFTTAQNEALTNSAANRDFGTEGPLSGLGYGLGISRAHARYFGGDLTLYSMDGYGTDAYLYLSRLTNHDEPLL